MVILRVSPVTGGNSRVKEGIISSLSCILISEPCSRGDGVVHAGPPFRLPYLISLKILISQLAAQSRPELCNDHQPIELFLYTIHTQPSLC